MADEEYVYRVTHTQYNSNRNNWGKWTTKQSARQQVVAHKNGWGTSQWHGPDDIVKVERARVTDITDVSEEFGL